MKPPLTRPFSKVENVKSLVERTVFEHRAPDGSVMWMETPSYPMDIRDPVLIGVSPVTPGQGVTVEYRIDGGPTRKVVGVPQPRNWGSNSQFYRAVLPAQLTGLVEFIPVLCFAGQPVSPRLGEAVSPIRYQINGVNEGEPNPKATSSLGIASARKPRWNWNTKYLGALTAVVRKEIVGATPDGFRIDWHVEEGEFIGPNFEAVVLPGATDWMRIRTDGIAIVSVQACFETKSGARIYGSYSGVFDLGENGYDRALRDDFAPMPPVVVTPTYATADPQLQWLNRVQCIGVGRVDMRAQKVEFDVYIIEVGQRKNTE